MAILTGNEHFTFSGMPINKLLIDFWAWNSSDLLNNTLRGALAEFIVAAGLDIDTCRHRKDWEAFDLLYGNVRIEVKSAAYLQAWERDKPSRIQFSIAPSRAWTAEQGYGADVVRHSDVYIFACFTCIDRASANPLALEQWDFYVLPTYVLNERCPQNKTISLPALLALGPLKASFEELALTMQEALSI